MASITTNRLRYLLLKGADASPDLDLINDATIKAMLVNSGYTPDVDHNFADSITAATSKELSGTGYVGGFGGAGRKALGTKTITQDDTANVAYFNCADIVWTAIDAGTVSFIAIIKEVTADTDSPLLAIIDVSPDIVTNGGNYTWTVAADGVFKLA